MWCFYYFSKNLNPNMPVLFCRSFTDPKPNEERVKEGAEALALGILLHTKAKQGHADAPHCIEMRHDVCNFLFKGKGKQGSRRGVIELEKHDFARPLPKLHMCSHVLHMYYTCAHLV